MTRLFTVVKSGVIAVVLMSGLFFGLAQTSTATTPPASNAALQAQIQMLMQLLVSLQAQLAALQATEQPEAVADEQRTYQYTNIDDGIDGVPTIVMTSNPGMNQTFNKTSVNDPIKVSWEAHNVPPHTQVQVEIGNIAPGAIGGGEWGSAIPEGDSRGVYNWKIHGEGLTSAGTYQVRVKLEECAVEGCNYNAHFPGREEAVTLYGTTGWRPIRVIGADIVTPSSIPTPKVSVTASALSIASGNSVLLRWSATNAQRCVLQYGSSEDDIPTSGSKTITPSEKMTYLVWCANDPGDGKDGPSGSAQVTVNVTAATGVQTPIPVVVGVGNPDDVPRKNAFSCNRTSGAKLASGELACYGLWDFGDAFGDDQNTCTSADHSTVQSGCVVKAPVCSSGAAITARSIDTYAPWHRATSISKLATSLEVNDIARNLQTNTAAVNAQLITVWEYRCGDGAVQNEAAVWTIPQSEPDILMAGVYQGATPAGSAGTHSEGTVDVVVTSANSNNTLLVLSAYEPVHWNVTGPGAAYVKGVFVTGYYNQRVTGLPANIPVVNKTYMGGAKSGDYFVAHASVGSQFDALADYLESRTGYRPYLFFGNDNASQVQIGVKG